MRLKRRIQPLSALVRALTLLAWVIGYAPVVAAQDAETRVFLDQEISGPRTSYIVTRDLNVRAAPDTDSARVGGLKPGQEVVSPGRHQGWVAIEENGEPVGFAYFKYLQPFVDGTLAEVITGAIEVGPRKCDYEINFAGKTQPDGEDFYFSDYNVVVSCIEGSKELAFDLFAFMSEGPYTRGKDSVHQIGVDLLAIAEDYDHVLSTIILFDHAKQRIDFDQITLDEYARKPEYSHADATSVAEAVEQAVRMTLAAWNNKVWEELAKALG